MTNAFKLKMQKIQPSQLYISSEKLEAVTQKIQSEGLQSLEPIPIKKLDDELVSTDGHTRMFALFLRGVQEFDAEWEDVEMDWEAYRICVEWCKEEGITSIANLQGRVIGPREYQKIWLDRCRVMQENLEISR